MDRNNFNASKKPFLSAKIDHNFVPEFVNCEPSTSKSKNDVQFNNECKLDNYKDDELKNILNTFLKDSKGYYSPRLGEEKGNDKHKKQWY